MNNAKFQNRKQQTFQYKITISIYQLSRPNYTEYVLELDVLSMARLWEFMVFGA